MLADALVDVSAAYLLCINTDPAAEISPDETLLLQRFRGAVARRRAMILDVAEQQASHA